MQIIESTKQENNILNRLKDEYIPYSEMIHSERRFLNSLLLRYKPKKLLEVGVSAGASSLVMLNAIKDDPQAVLYSLDYSENWYHDSSRKTGFLVDQYPDLKEQWRLKTGKLSFRFIEEIGDNIDFLFLDTMHSNPGELLDFLMVLPFLKKNCPVVLHDISLHTCDFNPQERSFQTTNNVLFAAFTGERLILQNNIQDSMAGRTPLANIGGVILADDARDHVWEIVNTLSSHWVYMPEENDLRDMQSFFAKFYDDASLDLLNQIINYHRFVRVAQPCVNRPIRKKCRKVLNQTLANLTFGSLRERFLEKVYKYTLQEKLAQQIRSISSDSRSTKQTGYSSSEYKEVYWDDSWKIHDKPLLSFSDFKATHGDDYGSMDVKPLSSFQKQRDPQNSIVMDICFASDDNYSPAVGVAITSILTTKKSNEHFRFYILDGGISEINKERLLCCASNESLTFLKVDNEKFQGFTVPDQSHFNITTYYRLLLPEQLPLDINRVIYLDCDILVLDSLADLWRHDLNGAHLAAVRDYGVIKNLVKMPEQIETENYVNAGILLIDLEKWRNDHIQEDLFRFVHTTKIPLPWCDQDVINIKLKDSIEYLSPVWNFMTNYEDATGINLHLEQIKIIHYAGPHKPWIPGNALSMRLQAFYHPVWRKTPWKCDYWKFHYLKLIKKIRQLPKQIVHIRLSSKVKYCVICGVTTFRFQNMDETQS